MNTKLHAVTDVDGRPIRFSISAGHVSDDTGAAALLGSLPKAQSLLADRGYNAGWFRDALKDKGIKPCISGRTSRGQAGQIRQAPQEDRDLVRSAEGLAKDCNPIRSKREGLPLGHSTRRDRDVLAMKQDRALTLVDRTLVWLAPDREKPLTGNRSKHGTN